MISCGAIVRVHRNGDVAWVAKRQEPDGRWRVVSKAVDYKSRAVFSSRTAGAGDITVIIEAPVFAAGAEIEHNGMQHIVIRDLGDSVELRVPPHSYKTHGSRGRGRIRLGAKPSFPENRRGVNLHIAGGNLLTIAKSDLALEALT